MKTLIIAEIGVNHNGDLALAQTLIEKAAEIGADFVKFQTFRAEQLVTKTASKAAYQYEKNQVDESQYQMLKKLELTDFMHNILVDYSKKCGISFLSTGFDIQSIDFLVDLGLEYFKVPSGEITNLPYLRHVGKLSKTIILSTGMATLGEVEEAINILEMSGTSRQNIIVLHCTTEYPAPLCEVNLRAMLSMQQAFKVNVGYSDHTLGIEVPVAAVALGACVIEKHFTLDRNLPGPDHKASLEPKEFKAMVESIRNIEMALGDGIKRPTASEIKNKAVARKSLVAKTLIKAGDMFNAENLTIKRPGNGISPMLWDQLIGTKSFRDYAPDELIQL